MSWFSGRQQLQQLIQIHMKYVAVPPLGAPFIISLLARMFIRFELLHSLTSWFRTAFSPTVCTFRGNCLVSIEMMPAIAVMSFCFHCYCDCCGVWVLFVEFFKTNRIVLGLRQSNSVSPLLTNVHFLCHGSILSWALDFSFAHCGHTVAIKSVGQFISPITYIRCLIYYDMANCLNYIKVHTFHVMLLC